MRKVISCLLLQLLNSLPGFTQAVVSPINYTAQGQVYAQNFDGLPNSGSFALTGKGSFNLGAAPVNGTNLAGWQFLMAGGTNTNASFLVSTGSSTGNGVQSLGPTGSTDRALGSLSTGSGIYAFGLVLTNNTGIALNSITVSFTTEQWRKGGSGNKNTWAFGYRTGNFSHIDQPDLLADSNLAIASVITTTGAGSLNGNLPENQRRVTYTLIGLTWKNGEQLLLRWDDADEPGSDDACGIDNFSFSAEQVEDTPSIFNKPVTDLSAHSVHLNCLVNDNNSTTDISIQYDTSANFTSAKIIHPMPDNIVAGTGTTLIGALLDRLAPGLTYYYRVKATNLNGSTVGTTIHFTTPPEPPDITTVVSGGPATNTAILGGIIHAEGGAPLTEKGIVWSSTNKDPTVLSGKVIIGSGAGNFLQLITGLPQGTTIYARAYAINTAGTAYGNVLTITTQTVIISFTTQSTGSTKMDTVVFALKTAQNISGLNISHFSLICEGVSNASIISVTGSGNSFFINVYTGTRDGNVKLQFTNDDTLLPSINNKPLMATAYYSIDKTPPIIDKVSIPDQAMKTGDTIPVTISVKKDAGVFKLVNANINAWPLFAFVKKNDSTYTCYFVTVNGGNDVSANADIPVSIVMADPLGNSNPVYREPIHQSNDPIDANKPLITQLIPPPDNVYKAGDTLFFITYFSEKIFIVSPNAFPYLKITVGNTARQASYLDGSGTNAMLFMYMIQSTDEDSLGIKVSTAITFTNGSIKDSLGNNAVLTLPAVGNHIIVDGVAPRINSVRVPSDKLYAINDTLVFTVNFTERIRINTPADTPVLKLIIGSTTKNMRCVGSWGNQDLIFNYIVQKNDLDKSGISLGTLTTGNTGSISDPAGNAAILTVRNAGSLANVKIDGLAPVFLTDNSVLPVCENDTSIAVTDLLAISDDEKGEIINWKITAVNHPESLSNNTATAISNGGKLSPANIIYKPSLFQKITDTLLAEITDGMYTARKIIIVRANPILNNYLSVSASNVCNGAALLPIMGSLPVGGIDAYQYLWELSTTNDSTNFTKTTGTNTQKDLALPKLSTTTWYRRKVISGNCVDISRPVKLTVWRSGLWMGSFSNDWGRANNWCGAVLPDQNMEVLVPANTGFDPKITDTGSCQNITIDKNARLVVKGVIKISGAMKAVASAIDMRNGKLVLDGTKPQDIEGNYFEGRSIDRFLISNPSGVSLVDTVYLTNALQLAKGSLQTNGYLTMRPMANIGASAEGTSIMGDVSVEHIIPGTKRQFRLLGHPLMNDIGLRMISDSIDISGNGGKKNGFIDTEINDPSAFYFDPLTANDSLQIDDNWTAFSHTDGQGENAWKRYKGIRLFIWGKSVQGRDGNPVGNGIRRTYLPGPLGVKFTGAVNTGDQELVLQKGAHSGYHLVGNPYLSAIDLSLVSCGNKIGKNYWVWNAQLGRSGGYMAIPFQSKFLLPSFGAFIVKTSSDTDNTILFTENCKVNEQPLADSFPITSLVGDYQVELRLEQDSIFWDRLLIYHSDSAKNYFDKFDGEKLMNSEVNFYSISSNQRRLSVDVRLISNTSVIPLGLQTYQPGTFVIRVSNCVLPAGDTLQLHDKYLNKWMPLEKDSAYAFATILDTASSGDKRFEIRSKPPAIDTFASSKTIQVAVGPVPAINEITVNYSAVEKNKMNIRILNRNGILVRSVPLGLQNSGQVSIPVNDLLPGVYFIEINSGKYSVSRKIIKL